MTAGQRQIEHRERPFPAYLVEFVESARYPHDLRKAVAIFFERVGLSPSGGGLLEDDVFGASWDKDDHYLEVEIRANSLEWFYKNRGDTTEMRELDSGETIEGCEKYLERFK